MKNYLIVLSALFSTSFHALGMGDESSGLDEVTCRTSPPRIVVSRIGFNPSLVDVESPKGVPWLSEVTLISYGFTGKKIGTEEIVSRGDNIYSLLKLDGEKSLLLSTYYAPASKLGSSFELREPKDGEELVVRDDDGRLTAKALEAFSRKAEGLQKLLHAPFLRIAQFVTGKGPFNPDNHYYFTKVSEGATEKVLVTLHGTIDFAGLDATIFEDVETSYEQHHPSGEVLRTSLESLLFQRLFRLGRGITTFVYCDKAGVQEACVMSEVGPLTVEIRNFSPDLKQRLINEVKKGAGLKLRNCQFFNELVIKRTSGKSLSSIILSKETKHLVPIGITYDRRSIDDDCRIAFSASYKIEDCLAVSVGPLVHPNLEMAGTCPDSWLRFAQNEAKQILDQRFLEGVLNILKPEETSLKASTNPMDVVE